MTTALGFIGWYLSQRNIVGSFPNFVVDITFWFGIEEKISELKKDLKTYLEIEKIGYLQACQHNTVTYNQCKITL